MRFTLVALLFSNLLASNLDAQQGGTEPSRLLAQRAADRPPATAHRDADGRPRFVNSLIRERSPYLLDSAHSPVNWLAWSEGTLEEGRARRKLLFVSIGYSSCHWCHEMARQSFDELGIATVLNRGYVSLKIDSEERPDLEERFLARLEALGVSPGWPMTFVLTPEGEVVWGATFVGRDELLAILERLEARWKTDRPRVRRLAVAREAQMRAAPTHAPVVGMGEAFARQGERIAADFDPVHKGFGTGRKFHGTAELGFLHEAFVRGGDEGPGRMFIETLRAIAASGLHDVVDGGVFRYSVTRDWLSPHFEKMLYDQALVARLMCEGYPITGDRALARTATDILDFVQSAFATKSGLLASSLDSESGGVEGGYYLLSAADIERLSPAARNLVASHARTVPQAGGRFLLAPAGPSAMELPASAREELRAIRKLRASPRRDEKAITAWNANMVSALAECATRLGDASLASQAASLMRRLLATNAPAGRIHRYSIAGDATGPATIDDLGWLLSALVSIHDADGSDDWPAHARALVVNSMATGDETLRQALRDFARDRNGPSASAVLVRALSQFVRRSDDAVFPAALNRMVSPLRELSGAPGFASLTAALFDIESPMPRQVAYAAQGKVRLSVSPAMSGRPTSLLSVMAAIRPGWHINSHEPGPDYLRPTRIEVQGAGDYSVRYPEGRPLRFGTGGDTLSVLDGSVRFDVRVPAGAFVGHYSRLRLTASIQACTDEICLRPETVELAAMRADRSSAGQANP